MGGPIVNGDKIVASHFLDVSIAAMIDDMTTEYT